MRCVILVEMKEFFRIGGVNFLNISVFEMC